MCKKLFTLTLFCILASLWSISVSAADNQPSLGDEFYANYELSVEMAREIRSSFGMNRSGGIEYPEFFGGMYIDSNGHFVILVVDDFAESGDEIARAFSSVRSSSIRFVEFSYSTLDYIFTYLSDFLHANWLDTDNDVVQNITAIGLDIVNNMVEVYMLNADAYNITKFENLVMSHPALHFFQCPGIILDSAVVESIVEPFRGLNETAPYMYARYTKLDIKKSRKTNYNIGFPARILA